jgi:hypothetical protein
MVSWRKCRNGNEKKLIRISLISTESIYFIKKKKFYTNNYSNAALFIDKNKIKDFFSITCYECDKKKYYANNYLKKTKFKFYFC